MRAMGSATFFPEHYDRSLSGVLCSVGSLCEEQDSDDETSLKVIV